MRIWMSVMISVLILFSFFSQDGQATSNLHVSANNAVLIEQKTGRILYSKKAHEKQSIASITKVMTAIIAIESGNLDDLVTTSRRAAWAEGSAIYLEEGEQMTLKDLIYGLMLRSGNDAAVAISEHLAGSVEGFSLLMNEKASWLGMTNTNFENPHGLESDNHYSTAYDMALLLRYAMDNDIFNEVSGTSSYISENRTYHWYNKNKLLTKYYEYCTGGKTGFTRKAGRTLISSANKNNMDLIAVTLNAPDDWQDHTRMFEWGYEHYDLNQLAEKGAQQYRVTEKDKHVNGYILEDFYYPLRKDELNTIKEQSYILLDEGHPTDQIGKKIFFLNSNPIIDIPIYSSLKQKEEEKWFSSFLKNIKQIVGLK